MLLIFDSLIKKRRPLFFLPPSALARLSHPALSPPGSRPPLVLILLILAPAPLRYQEISDFWQDKRRRTVFKVQYPWSAWSSFKHRYFGFNTSHFRNPRNEIQIFLTFYYNLSVLDLKKGEIKAHKTKLIKSKICRSPFFGFPDLAFSQPRFTSNPSILIDPLLSPSAIAHPYFSHPYPHSPYPVISMQNLLGFCRPNSQATVSDGARKCSKFFRTFLLFSAQRGIIFKVTICWIFKVMRFMFYLYL